MRQLYLIKHGSYNRRTGNLTEEGIAQANKLARTVAAERPQIMSSPAERAKQTADILARRLQCPVHTNEALGTQSMPVEERIQAINQIVKNSRPELLIVTHAGIVADYGMHTLQEQKARQSLEIIMPGEGLHFNILEKKYLLVPSKEPFATNL